MAKKIIGMSCGKKNGNCESFLKAALMGAEELGIQSEIIRVMDYKILPCTGCWACHKVGKCIQKDDIEWILDKTVPGDTSLIISAPVYHIRVNGVLMCIAEKMNHLLSHRDTPQSKRMGGIISVGGSGYDGWTSLGLTTVNLFLQHLCLLVDQVQINHCAQKEAALTPDNRWAIERCKQLGRNIAKAMSIPPEDVKFVGEDTAVSCPVCHCNIIYVEKDFPDIACPVCAVHGKVSYAKGKFSVNWNRQDIKHPRFSLESGVHHRAWLNNHHKDEFAQLDLPETKELIKKYEAYGNYMKPDKPTKTFSSKK
jgi:multimeric flavodoxin WrbA